MKRIDAIKSRIVNVAARESGIGKGMRIPGMKIGTQMSPRGPNYEDIMWLADSLEKAKEFMKTAEYEKKEDMHVAIKLVQDIEEGR